jgi:tetratricopeptide (TPR) repeat protein
MRRLAGAIAALCAVAACGPPVRVAGPDVQALARARERLTAAPALVRAGCLDCLIDAVRDYEAAREVPAFADEATGGAARAAALVALRERELGIEPSGALERSRALSASSLTLEQSMSLLFDVGETLSGRSDGGPVRSDAEMVAAGLAARNRVAWTESLRARADENELTAYLWVAFNCTYNSPSNAAVEALLGDIPSQKDTPLIRYRIATCTALRIPALTELLDANPRFHEITYYMGLDAIIQGNLDEADAQFERAYQWRPRWASLANTRGNVFMTAEDFEQASEFYDQALSLAPDHVQALLGKARALTFAGRYTDALTATDALLMLERWFIGDARYLRALNELQLGRYDDAWTDIERAAALITNAEVPKLAGIIAVQRQQSQVARAKFEEARRRNGMDCEVPFYLGSVLVERREWALAAEAFIAAAGCFDESQTDIEDQIARIRTSEASPTRQARQIARREQQLASQARMRATSWFNTAAACFNLARHNEARQYAERVTDDAQFGPRARDLLARLPALR